MKTHETPVSIPAPDARSERVCWRSSEGSSQRGGRFRRAERSAAGVNAGRYVDELLDAGRSAFVTPERLPAAPAGARRVGLAGVAVSSALPPSGDGGAGRKNGMSPARRGRPEGGSRETASLRAGLPVAGELTPGESESVPQPAREALVGHWGVDAGCGKTAIATRLQVTTRGAVSRWLRRNFESVSPMYLA